MFEFLARLTSHIPDKGQVLQRYYGFYSSRQRGKRRKANGDGEEEPLVMVDPGSVIRMVLRGAMALVLIGGVIGLVLTVGLTRLISQFLYGVSGVDPVVALRAE